MVYNLFVASDTGIRPSSCPDGASLTPQLCCNTRSCKAFFHDLCMFNYAPCLLASVESSQLALGIWHASHADSFLEFLAPARRAGPLIVHVVFVAKAPSRPRKRVYPAATGDRHYKK